MQTRTRYGFGVEISGTFADAVERTKQACAAEGFGTLSEIDVRRTLREKIDHDIEPYTILGVCNPNLAARAIEGEHEIGLLLPCNVLVHACQGKVSVSVQDPMALVGLTGNEQLRPIAAEAREKLEKALARLEEAK